MSEQTNEQAVEQTAPRVLVWLIIEQFGGPETAYLLVRRKANETPFAGVWALPGEVMPEEDSANESITRVARSHLDLHLRGSSFVETLNLHEGEQEYAVNIFRVAWTGRPRFRESGPYEAVAWLAPADLRGLTDMPTALQVLLIQQGSKAQS